MSTRTKLDPGELDALQPLDPLEVRLTNGITVKCFYLGYTNHTNRRWCWLEIATENTTGVGLEGAHYSFDEIDAVYLIEEKA